MAITLIVEDGSGKSDANSYASRATGDAYADSRLWADSWSGATEANKDKALAMATRIIDQEFVFNGFKMSSLQALQWPRVECPDPDVAIHTLEQARQFFPGPYVDPTIVPTDVVNATCELAIQLLGSDRTGDAQGQGVRRINLAGAMEIEFEHGAAPLVVTRDVMHALAKFGKAIGASSGTAKLVRT